MAVGITITPQITGQQADSTNSYCYLWEPLRVAIEEADVAAKKIYIELTTYSTENSIILNEALVKYAEYDINPGQPLTIDLMKIASQHHDSNVYKYSNISQMIDALGGWKSVVSEWRYKFRITSDITTTPVEIRKLPIIGGRIFKDFTAVVDETQDMIESDIYGVDLNLGRYDGMTYLITSLKDPSLQDCSPSVTTSTVGDSESLTQYCGGQLIWKSRFGGWLSWGFKQLEEKYSKQRYNGQVAVGMFESTSITNGTPYVPVNYTGITSDYSITLKELGLSSAELQTVASISSSPAVYRVLNDDGDLELMQVVNASHPLVNSANGGDFSVTLKSVSETFQKTR
tara:strand:- start:2103 stop:3131 length:1029 start_codon:yes stop_codon:yes gene_type:complete